MARAPKRSGETYFVGAGLGTAFGIPNTQQLLDEVHELAKSPHSWANSAGLEERLNKAYWYFYPLDRDRSDGYRPNVADFFSVLKTFTEISRGLPDKFKGAPELLSDLRRALANLLIAKLRAADSLLRQSQPELERILTPGNMVVTTNWDVLLERYAGLHGIPIRHRWSGPKKEITLVKLHGSIDWCLRELATKPRTTVEYSSTRERLFGDHPYLIRLTKDDEILRIRALETWSSAWQRVKSRAKEPLMITMALGKAGELGPLTPQWKDAYYAVSSAKKLHIIGYSLPPDDIEIRTLLVAGVERGGEKPEIVVRNPSPEVHNRFRAALSHGIQSDYKPVAANGD